MRKYTPYKISLLLLNFALASTQTSVVINNESSCQLTLGNICHDSNKTSLMLPSTVAPDSMESGQISFSSNWSSDPQRAVGSYIMNCDNKNYLLTLYFYVGKGPSEFDSHVGYWVDKKLMDTNAPVIIYPSGKTSIANNAPVVIGLIDTEIAHEPNSKPDPEITSDPLPSHDATDGTGASENQNLPSS